MKPLWLTCLFLIFTATFIVAQRPSQNESHPSTPPPANAPAPAPSNSNYNTGGGSNHPSLPPSNSGGNMGGSSSHGNPANSGGGRADSSGNTTRSDRSNPGGNNASRSDHSNTNNTRSPEHHAPTADGTRNTPTDRRVHPVDSSSGLPNPATGSARPGRDTRREPALNRPVAEPKQATGETRHERHFHWFWQKSPKNPESNDPAKGGHPELKRPTPCKGINCSPGCPAGQARGESGRCVPITPVHDTCRGTIDSAGNCVATVPCSNGVNPYDPNCTNNSLNANRHDCNVLASDVAVLQAQIDDLRRREQIACSQDPGGQECQRIREELRRLQEHLSQLQTQYSTCMNRQHP